MSRRDPGGPQRPRELAMWGRENADPGKPGGAAVLCGIGTGIGGRAETDGG